MKPNTVSSECALFKMRHDVHISLGELLQKVVKTIEDTDKKYEQLSIMTVSRSTERDKTSTEW